MVLGNTPGNNTVNILFILDECKDEDFFVSNIDIESLSQSKVEKEVLFLPLSCFEIVKIGNEEVYQNVKYRKIYLCYLDKYKEKINSKINELNEKNEKNEINNFFTKSIKSQFGESVQKCYDKKNKLSTKYAQAIKATPYNIFFINKIAASIILNVKKPTTLTKQTAAHLDDEVSNLIGDIKCKDSKDKDMCKIEDKNIITKYIDEELLKLNINIEDYENGYSIGYCLGNFLSNYDSFLEAPTSAKAVSLASLALACGLPII